MSFILLKSTGDTARVRIETIEPREVCEWIVDRRDFGNIGAIRARSDSGRTATLGMFRTKDGSQMDPDYARLRKWLTAVKPGKREG